LFGGTGGALPDGTQVYMWNGTGYNVGSRDDLLGDANGWDSGFETNVLNPGTGMFIHNSGAAAFTVTFVGEVLQGSLSNHISSGFALLASQVPQKGQLDTDLGFPAVDGDQVYQWVNTNNTFSVFSHDSLLNTPPPWGPVVPIINVGEGFFSSKAAATDWLRTFTVQ
jgi:hypothetical protein